MQSQRNDIGWRFWHSWVLATAIGWAVGIITAFIVAHLVNIVYPKETNLVVGLCLGAVVGYMQKRFAHNPMTASGRWVLSTSIGMGIPFVVVVIADELRGGTPAALSSPLLTVAVGGLITGLLQMRNMRRHSRISGWWILASIVGWGLAWLVVDIGFGIGLLLAGALLGAVTGGAIVWLLRCPRSPEQVAVEAMSTGNSASST